MKITENLLRDRLKNIDDRLYICSLSGYYSVREKVGHRNLSGNGSVREIYFFLDGMEVGFSRSPIKT